MLPTMKSALDAGEQIDGVVPRHDGRPTGLCGVCGRRHLAGSLLDFRQHMITSLRQFAFICGDCKAVFIRPGRKMKLRGVKAISKSAMVRGFPGSEATAKAHELRARARNHPDQKLNLDELP